MILGREFAPQK